MILGTAGHVDHGKTALVKALTGVDTDRLPEEKRRGITIELGFAPLRYDDGLTLGVVDVPGHEAFVRQMLAGATGIDLAMLVVAADEGVMPQTREHLAVLDLLGIRGGVVAISKSDLVDADWLDLVTDDLETTLAGTTLEHAPIVRVSAVTGQGIAELRLAIRRAAAAIPAREASDVFRLPVDRVFSIKGTGTVVTGTVWSGTLGVEDVVQVFPGGRTWRVRGIQSHGAPIARAEPGTRAAIALSGAELGDVPRGAVVVSGVGWAESRTVIADVALLDDAPRALGARTAVRFHLGTADVRARVVTARGAIAPGERASARVVLDEPIAARGADRFVLRSASPVATIGGGVILDPQPSHRRERPWSAESAGVPQRLAQMLDRAGPAGVTVGTLPVRLGVRPAECDVLIRDVGSAAVGVGDVLVRSSVVVELSNHLERIVAARHRSHPLDVGAPLQSVRARLAAPDALVDHVLRESVAKGVLAVDGGMIRQASWQPTLDATQTRTVEQLREALEVAGKEPPSVRELEEKFGASTGALLRWLERSGVIVQVEPDRYFARAALDAMVRIVRQQLDGGRQSGPAELREALGVSRKFLIPFLEYCDRSGVTERRAEGRVLSVKHREARIA